MADELLESARQAAALKAALQALKSEIGEAGKKAADASTEFRELAAKQLESEAAARRAEDSQRRLQAASQALEGALSSVSRVASIFSGAFTSLAQGAAAAEQHARALHLLGSAYEEVRRQTNDTVSAEEALRVRQQLTQSGFAVTAQQLGVITRAAREYALETGGNAAQATEQLTQSLIAGEAGGLRRFGVTVNSTHGRVRNFSDVVRQLAERQRDAAPAARTMAEENEALARSFGNLTTTLTAQVARWLELRGAISEASGLIDRLQHQSAGTTARNAATGLGEAARTASWTDTALAWFAPTRVGMIAAALASSQDRADNARSNAELEQRGALRQRFQRAGGDYRDLAGIHDLGTLRQVVDSLERTGANVARAVGKTEFLAARSQERLQRQGEQAAQAAAEAADHSRDQQNAQGAQQAQQRALRLLEAQRQLADVQREGLYLGAQRASVERRAHEEEDDFTRRQTEAQRELNQQRQQYLQLLQPFEDALHAAENAAANRSLVRSFDRDARYAQTGIDRLRADTEQLQDALARVNEEARALAVRVADRSGTRADEDRLRVLQSQAQVLSAQQDAIQQRIETERRAATEWRRDFDDRRRVQSEDRATRRDLHPFEATLGASSGLRPEEVEGRAARVQAELTRTLQRANEVAARIQEGRGNEADRTELDMLHRRAESVSQLVERYRDLAETQREAGDVGLQVSHGLSTALQLQTTAAQQWGSLTEGAVNNVMGAFKQHFGALITGKETAGEALKGMLADTLQSLATESAVRAIFMTAKGVADAASGNYASAAEDFASAGLFAAVAGLAGAATYGLSQTGSAPAAANAPSAASGASQFASTGSSGSSSRKGGDAAPVVINFSSNNVIDDRDTIQRHLVRAIHDARRQGARV